MVKKVGAMTHSIGICYPPYRLVVWLLTYGLVVDC